MKNHPITAKEKLNIELLKNLGINKLPSVLFKERILFQMEKCEINKTLVQLQNLLDFLAEKINIPVQKERIKVLTNKMEQPFFWQDNHQSIQVTQELHKLETKISTLTNFQKKVNDLSFLFDCTEIDDLNFSILVEELLKIKKQLQSFEIDMLLNQTHDENNAILILHPGAGGTEAQDWCEILYRMYQKYAERKKFKTQILYIHPDKEAGLKSVTLLIQGLYAYGYLKAEKGVHRMVRISPFDANYRRHTSFASCEVLPEINHEIAIDLKDEDLRIDVFRSSGAGGQHVNTTDSAVRITHLPTNTVVNCQQERSQIKNREKALQILKTKLLQLEEEKKKENKKTLQGEQKNISWGSQIRSYIFHPYQMVKDHRTNYEVFQLDAVINGYLDDLINVFLRQESKFK